MGPLRCVARPLTLWPATPWPSGGRRLHADAGWGHIPPRAPRGGAQFTGRPVSRDRAALEDVTTDAAAGPGLLPRYCLPALSLG